MMRFTWRSPNAETPQEAQSARGKAHGDFPYRSTLCIESQTVTGVRFFVRKVSLGMRIELMRQIREISKRIEFLAAGDELQERIEANLLQHEVDAAYLRWGLVEVTGLVIDGQAVTADVLIEKGPEELTREIVAAIRVQCGLSDDERKN